LDISRLRQLLSRRSAHLNKQDFTKTRANKVSREFNKQRLKGSPIA
jgi:hypothetical protein